MSPRLHIHLLTLLFLVMAKSISAMHDFPQALEPKYLGAALQKKQNLYSRPLLKL